MFLLPRPVVCSRDVDAVRRRSIALILVIAFLGTMTVPAFARAPQTPDPGVVKRKVQKLGVGEHVAVKRVAGETLHGHIIAIGEQSFQLHADKATSDTEIPYDQVLNVKKNPGAVTWMLVGAAIVVIILIVRR